MLSTALVHQGCTVTIVSLDKDREVLKLPSSISHITLNPPWLNIKYSFSFQLIAWLLRNAQRFDVVIVHGIWQFPSLAALIALPRFGVPFIIYAHGMLTNNSLFRTRTKVPKKLLYWTFVERHTLANAAAVVFTSEWELIHSEKAAKATKFHGVVIKNGLPPPPVEPQDSSEQPPKGSHLDPYLLCLGRLDPVKGVDIVLRSFAAVNASRFRLVIAGKGESWYEQRLRRMVSDLGMDNRVQFVGHVQGAKKWALIREAFALLAPSHHENFGIALVEALSVGCPVLTTRQVGVWREIERFQAGLLFAANADECADAIRRFVQLDTQEYLRYRDNALSCFDNEFSIDMTARALKQLFSSLRGPQTRTLLP
ncbi:MAG: glycosyltransferase [Acidobacteriia bacterium]|nr:glycosyltransferase [Terriglobia bacterium]